MKLFATYRKVFTWFRILPFPDGTDRKTLRRTLAFSVIVVLSDLLPLVSSVLYLYKNVWKNQADIGTSLYPVAQISGYGCTLYTVVAAFIIREKIRNMLDKVQEIYDGLFYY